MCIVSLSIFPLLNKLIEDFLNNFCILAKVSHQMAWSCCWSFGIRWKLKLHTILLTHCISLYITLLLKLISIEEIGCRTEIGGTALLSFLYHISNKVTSEPTLTNSSLNNSNSDETMYVGIGR